MVLEFVKLIIVLHQLELVYHGDRQVCKQREPCGLQRMDVILIAVSYTHLTLPTNREV